MPSLFRHNPTYQLGVLILTSFFIALAAPVIAQGKLIESVELLEDPTGSLGVKDVLQETFYPASDTLSLGYTTSAEWLRLRILPTPDGEDVVILFGSGKPDELRFYAPIFAGFGDSIAHLEDVRYQARPPSWPSPLPAFVITPPEGGADYFVRIATSGSVWLDIKALPLSEALVTTERGFIFQIVYLSVMFVLFLWSLQMALVARAVLFSWFALLQIAWLVNNILYLGYGSSLLPNLSSETLSLLLRMSVFVATFFSVTFHRAVMLRFESGRLSLRLFDVQLAVIAIAFILFLSYDRLLALQINAACLAAAPFVFLINVATARKAVAPGLITLRVLYGLLSLSFFLNAFAVLGLINIKALVIHGYMIHGLSTGLLMFLLLHFTARDIFFAARKAEADRIEAEHQNTLQKEKNQALSEFIEMLSHEAKNALSVIRMSLSGNHITDARRARIADVILGLTGVIDRCEQLIMLEDDEPLLAPQDCDLVDILQRLSSNSVASCRITLRWQDRAVIWGDPVILEVVLGNLLDNATKYAPADSDISIEVLPEDNGHSVLFTNAQGEAGAPDPGHVFKKYYRNSLAQTEIGSGLGLYIVHKLVMRMGGIVEYLPTKQQVRFRVWFPC